MSRDAELRGLEREVAENPHDLGRSAALAQAYLRAGHTLLALQRSRGVDADLHREAAEALGSRLDLTLEALLPSEVWRTQAGERLVLIPGGAFLDEGTQAFRSSLSEGGSRAPLARVEVPAFLISTLPLARAPHADLTARLDAEGDRLPTFVEWKKSWRGGLFLDGDARAQLPNSEPDRLRPAGFSSGGGIERSPYGVLFPTAGGGHEWSSDSNEWSCALTDEGRYRVPGGHAIPPAGRRVRTLDPLA